MLLSRTLLNTATIRGESFNGLYDRGAVPFIHARNVVLKEADMPTTSTPDRIVSGTTGINTMLPGYIDANGAKIDGTVSNDDDTLDLTGAGPFHIVYDPLSAENGVVNALTRPTATRSAR